ncbi:galanin receptor type 2-like [Mercenaria mercenaria]|uniref:galanin receptor type 2-like n=1 Tax=Mercenaria mercenaria TaxID=6596 RepID=UPI001E1DCD44|nr:galanin receptor type 2-like [Mercenaria mercenaria]
MLENQTFPGNISDIEHYGSTRRTGTWLTLVTGICLSPVIVLGVLGNIFSLLVWVKGRRRKTSTARYLSALAVADIIVLLTTALEFWLSYVVYLDIKVTGTFTCKFFYFMAFFAPSLSAWILAAVTIERALSVWIPHKINVACQPVTAVVVSGVVSFLLCLLYLPILTSVDVVDVYTPTSTWKECSPLSDTIYRQNLHAWFYIDLCIFFLLPFVVMLICNVSILAKVVCLAQKRSASLHARGQNQTSAKSKKMLKTVTRRIVILTIAYIVCNSPLSVLNVILSSSKADYIVEAEHVQFYRIPFHVLMFVNNGVNFLLYCLIGSGFRKDFMSILRPSSRTSTTR